MARIPPATHTPRMRTGVCSCCATTYGLMKMPAPTMPPITIMVASNRPTCRSSPGEGFGEDDLEVEEVNAWRLANKDTTVACGHRSRSRCTGETITHRIPLRRCLRGIRGNPVVAPRIKLVQHPIAV